MATYRTCVADAKTQKQELEDTKVTVLRQIQEVIRQSDQTIKSVGARCPHAPAVGRRGRCPCSFLTPPHVHPTGNHLLLPDDAHADGPTARALPDAL